MWLNFGNILSSLHPSACAMYYMPISYAWESLDSAEKTYLDLGYGRYLVPSIGTYCLNPIPGRAHDFHQESHLGRSVGNLAPPDLARASVARVLIGHLGRGREVPPSD
jgi:hypothetical protein